MVSRSAPVSWFCGVAVALLLGEVHAQQAKAAPTPLLEIAQRAAPRKQTTKHLPGVDPVVGSALQWLLAQQQADGRWPADDFLAASGDNPVAATDCTTSTIAITGLALWALAREGPAADGDPRREPMLRAARWLMRQQPNDVIGHPDAHLFVYGHAIGLLGLCATVAATGDDTCREAAERAGKADAVDLPDAELVHQQAHAGIERSLGKLDCAHVVLDDLQRHLTFPEYVGEGASLLHDTA